MPIPSGFASHIDLLDPLCYPGSGLIIEDLASPSTVWNISSSGAVYDPAIGSLTLSTQSIEANSSLVSTGTGAISIAGWIKVNSYTYGSPFNALPAVGSSGGGNNFRQYPLYGGTANAIAVASASNTSGAAVYGASEQPINQWCFVVITKAAGSNTAQIVTYLNGVNDVGGNYGTPVTTNITYSGTFSYGAINTTKFGDNQNAMSISQIWIYNSQLSAGDVADLYNATKGRYGKIVEFDFQNPACFDGTGTTLTDLSGNGSNFTLNNTSYTYDAALGALTLPSGTYADGDPADFVFGTNPLTISAWVKMNTSVPGINICYFGGSAAGSRTQLLWRSSDNLIVVDNASSAGAWNYTADNQWHLLTLTRPANPLCNDQKVYLDGVLIPFSASAFNPTQVLNSLVGSARLHDTSDTLEIATFEVYSTQLDANAILDIYNSTRGRFVTPIIEYDFSDPACYPGTGNTIFNLQPASYDFPIVNSTTFVGAGSSSYFTFNGVNQYIGQGFSGGPGFGTTFTATVWVQANNGNIGSIWNSGFDSPLGREPGMYINARAFTPDPGYADASFNFGIGYLDLASPQVIGDWFNLAYVADGTNVSLYVNGVLDSTGSQGTGQWAAGGFVLGAHLSSGGGVDGPFLNAKIAYYSAYDVALGSTQISDIYNLQASRFAPSPPPSSNGVGGRQFAQGFNG